MTDGDRNLRESFERLDRSVQPPASLRDHVFTGFGLETERSSRLRSIISGRSFGLISGLAAAAAIVVMIGAGLLLFGDHPATGTPTSTPVVYASDPGSPIAGLPTAEGTSVAMFGGSLAQNGSYPGTVPSSGKYVKLWSQDVDQGTSFSAFFGDVLYVEGAAYDLHVTTTLSAYDSASGQLLWQTTVLTAPLTVFDGGVVVLQPVSSESGDTTVTYQVSLLDRMSGAIKWTVPGTFTVQPTDFRGLGWIGLAGTGIVLQVDERTLVLLDAATGVERWRYASTGTTTIDCNQQPCTVVPASWGNTLYLVDQFAHSLVAIDLSTELTLWSFDFDGGAASESRLVSPDPNVIPFLVVHATASGPLLEAHNPPEDNIVQYTLFDAATGAIRWFRVAGDPRFALTDTSLYIHLNEDDPESGKGIQQIDLVTGALTATFPNAKPDAFNTVIYLPASNVLLAGTRSLSSSSSIVDHIPVISSIFGSSGSTATLRQIDPATLATLGTSEFKKCFVDSSISDDGKLLCTNEDGSGFAVYGPEPTTIAEPTTNP